MRDLTGKIDADRNKGNEQFDYRSNCIGVKVETTLIVCDMPK